VFRSFARNGLAFAAASLFFAAVAHADDWRVVQSTGPLWVHTEGMQSVSLGPDTVLPDGATLTTGEGSRVLLAHGTQTLIVGPNAVVTIPAGDSGGITTVLQRAGAVEFDVDRQNSPHFAVETPFLAAIVKGTHFTVKIDDFGANVAVVRGLVEVTDLASGEKVDVPPGQNANVTGGPDGKLTVGGGGQRAAVLQGAPRSPLVSLVSAGELASLQADTSSGEGSSSRADSSPQNGGLTALGAAGSGGNGGNGGGGSLTEIGSVGTSPATSGGDQAGSGGGDLAAAGGGSGTMATYGAENAAPLHALTSLAQREDEGPLSTMTIAISAGLSILLAVGFAYLRGRTG
jgi:hypothetical protein